MYRDKTILINKKNKKHQNGINVIISNLSNEMSLDVLNLKDIAVEKNIKYYFNFFQYFPILFVLYFYNKNHFKSFIELLKIKNVFFSYKDYNLIFWSPSDFLFNYFKKTYKE